MTPDNDQLVTRIKLIEERLDAQKAAMFLSLKITIGIAKMNSMGRGDPKAFNTQADEVEKMLEDFYKAMAKG